MRYVLRCSNLYFSLLTVNRLEIQSEVRNGKTIMYHINSVKFTWELKLVRRSLQVMSIARIKCAAKYEKSNRALRIYDGNTGT